MLLLSSRTETPSRGGLLSRTDCVVRRNIVHRRRDFMGMSTIRGMGTGREDRFAGGMNIIKYSTFPVEGVAYFHLSCGGSSLF